MGTAEIMGYFDGVVPPPFTIQDAIAAGNLTPYSYRPHRVSLDDDEQAAWDRLTAEIGRQLAIRGEEEPAPIDDAIRRLLIQRARVAKKAAAKSPLAAEVVSRYFEQGQRWLVYCEDREQLRAVRGAIGATGIREVYEYHSAMEGDPESTLRVFEQSGGVVIAIRCLDEGCGHPGHDPRPHPGVLAQPEGVHPTAWPRSSHRTREVDCAHPRRHRPPFRPSAKTCQ